MTDLKKDYEEARSTILDCFTGADGGITFVRMNVAMQQFIETDDPNTDKLVDIFVKMAKLIDALTE